MSLKLYIFLHYLHSKLRALSESVQERPCGWGWEHSEWDPATKCGASLQCRKLSPVENFCFPPEDYSLCWKKVPCLTGWTESIPRRLSFKVHRIGALVTDKEGTWTDFRRHLIFPPHFSSFPESPLALSFFSPSFSSSHLLANFPLSASLFSAFPPSPGILYLG